MLGRRVLTGFLVAGAWFLALCYMPGWMLFLVLLVMSGICQYEFYTMMQHGGYSASRKFGVAMGVVWLVVSYAFPSGLQGVLPADHQLECVVPVVLGFALLLRTLFDRRVERAVEFVAVTMLGFFYLPFMLSFFVRVVQWGATGLFEIPATRVGVFMASYLALVVKMGDVGAFSFGVSFGKHKMFPRISPKKSWEGLIGGLLTSMVFSLIMVLLARRWDVGGPIGNLTNVRALILGLVLSGVGVLGDLVESMFKRAVNAKDSAGLLPGGMGGILDMFDSLIFAPAALYCYLVWFAG